MIQPPPRPVDAYRKGLPRTTAGLLAAFLLGAVGFGAVTAGELSTWAAQRALADAPTVQAQVIAVDVAKAGRWSQHATLAWAAPELGERRESVRVSFAGDLGPMKALQAGGPVAVHVRGEQAVSAPTLAAFQPWEIPIVLGVLLLTALLLVPVTLDAWRGLTRIRDWPVVMAEVQVVGGTAARPKLTLRYTHAGQGHSAETSMTSTDLRAWADQVGASPQGPLPLMLDPKDPSRWRPCRFEWGWVRA